MSKTQKKSKKAATVAGPAKMAPGMSKQRMDVLFEHWWFWMSRLRDQFDDQHILALDLRSCIVIDQVGRDTILFCASTMVARDGEVVDASIGMFFKRKEGRRIFDKYHWLKADFTRLKNPAGDEALHVKAETWAKQEDLNWTRPLGSGHVNLMIASLVAHWDVCISKPPMDCRASYNGPRLDELGMVPKMVRIDCVPKKLSRPLAKYAIDRAFEKMRSR